MADEKKGLTVKIDAELHAQVREYVESHGMTMAEFVSQALDDELHPKQQMGGTMENNRTIAFQVSEELYRQIKEYLNAHHMTQKEFMIGLIQQELERDQQAVHEETEDESQDESEDEELDEDESEENDEEVDEDESEENDEEVDEDESEEDDEEVDEDDEELDEDDDESEENDEELDEEESPEMGM